MKERSIITKKIPMKIKRILRKSQRQCNNLIHYKKRKKIILNQKKILSNYDCNTNKLIVFVVPDIDIVNGGIMSIVSIYKETLKLKNIHESEVLLCTFPSDQVLGRYTKFKNDANIFSYNIVLKLFKNVEYLMIHMPEIYVNRYCELERKTQKNFSKLKSIHLNILNQNILLMPDTVSINKIKEKVDVLTCTTAHDRYSNLQNRNLWGLPLHKLSTFVNPQNYLRKKFDEKENIIVISPDENRYKTMILNMISERLTGITTIVIQNMPYDDYKFLIGKAKWALTFGEGMDGYFIETIMSGGIGIAVYNEDFFTCEFKDCDMVYDSYENMFDNIVNDILKSNNNISFPVIQEKQFNLVDKLYNYDNYVDNVKRFYLGQYDFP